MEERISKEDIIKTIEDAIKAIDKVIEANSDVQK